MRFLWFGLEPAPRIFTKLLKILLALLHRLKIYVILYVEDKLVFVRTMEEALVICKNMIYILQFLGVIINLKKSILVIVQEIEFLGMIITSREMTLSAPKQKMENIGEMCLVFSEIPKNIAADKTFRSFDFKDSGNTTSCQATVPVSAAGTKKTYQLKNSYQATLTLGLLALKELQL